MRTLKLVAIATIVAAVLPLPALAMQSCPVGSCVFGDISGWDNTGRNGIVIHVHDTVKNNATALQGARTARDRWNNCSQVEAGNTPVLNLNE